MLFVFQRNMLYHPEKDFDKTNNVPIEGFQEIFIENSDKQKLQIWSTKPTNEKQEVIIYFHGNSGNLNLRINKIQEFANRGYGVIVLSYRGFGKSQGKPTEDGLYDDALTAINHAKEQGYLLKNIIVYGESLGSGVAIEMATRMDFKAVILEAPYKSIVARAKELYPYIFVNLLVRDKFDSISKINKVKSPVLVIHGELDEVMPISHGKEILAKANEPKKGVFLENYAHSDFDLKILADLVYNFVEKTSSQ